MCIVVPTCVLCICTYCVSLCHIHIICRCAYVLLVHHTYYKLCTFKFKAVVRLDEVVHVHMYVSPRIIKLIKYYCSRVYSLCMWPWTALMMESLRLYIATVFGNFSERKASKSISCTSVCHVRSLDRWHVQGYISQLVFNMCDLLRSALTCLETGQQLIMRS